MIITAESCTEECTGKAIKLKFPTSRQNSAQSIVVKLLNVEQGKENWKVLKLVPGTAWSLRSFESLKDLRFTPRRSKGGSRTKGGYCRIPSTL